MKNFLLLLLAIGFLISIYFINPIQRYKQYSLTLFYGKIIQASKKNDCAMLYDMLSDNFKSSTSKETYVAKCQSGIQPISIDFYVYSIRVDGNIGYVDRNMVECFSTECTGKNRYENRVVKKYIFENWHWVIPDLDNSIYCSRNYPYSNPEEFNRAVSLIIQREKQGTQNAIDFGNSVDQIKNCLDIQYAQSAEDMTGADGLFAFSNESNTQDLKILVSPKYQVTDDLLTAILLAHEISHAMFYSAGSDKSMSCYENEAAAFTNQFVFMTLLNQEEKNSLVSRFYTSGNAQTTLNQFVYISKLTGSDYYHKALNYVQSDQSYISECSGK